MATLAEHPVVAQTSYDQDIDSFLNLDQISYTPPEPARSKIGLTPQPSLPSSEFLSSDARSSSFASSSQSPVAFPAPSHQYDEHKQQTGLPPGALAQAIPFNNQMPPMGYGAPSPGFAMNGDMFQPQIKRDEGPLDFNSTPARNLSEMDLEADSTMATVPGFYFPNNTNKNQFVDPNALGGQEVVSMGPSTQVGRMYPGMHQQAAMAKAAQQQRQHDMIRQQQQRQQQQQQQQHQQQHQQQQQHEQLQQQRNGTPQAQHPQATNAVVEERISRLLQQMKSASGSPSDSSPSPSAAPHMGRSKKDEHDMDEDERLLASEEGKKLSSKERRQLRNKVSARAFRSRRKEYIGQLENEVSQRTNEAQELRIQNRALYEENARLTDLARMLLSSPNFSQFLDEMNVNGLPSIQPQLSQQPQPPTISQTPVQQPNLPKEPTPNHGQQEFQMQQQNSQIGMMMVPSQSIDVATMNMNSGGWNTGIDVNFGNAPVFAVLEVPEPHVLDTDALSGKPSGFDGMSFPEASSSKDAPLGEHFPVDGSEEQTPVDAGELNVEVDESDPVLGLFSDQPKQSVSEVSQSSSFDGIASGKSAVFEIVVENDSRTAANRLAHLCNSMEDAFQRRQYIFDKSLSTKRYEALPSVIVPMKFYYQVLTTPTADTPGTTLLLHFPNKRYLFGQISEGTQRACTENGTKLTSVSDIFLSGPMRWENTGGLIGMILTKADGVASSTTALEAAQREKEANRHKHSGNQTGGKQEATNAGQDEAQHDLTVHGGGNLAHTLATARRFIFRKGLPVYTKEYDTESTSKRLRTSSSDPFEEPTWSDENVKVWAMPISPSSGSQRSQSPRKRSLDEFREETTGLVEVNRQSHDQVMRESVVASMFNSNWSLDSLEETRLADVNMPAHIFVRNPVTKDLEKYTGPLPGEGKTVPEMNVLVRKPWPGASVEKIPTTTKREESLCYIVKNHDLRGKFDPKKALALNIKPGPNFSILTKGQSVTSTDGKVVTPEMVIDPPRPGKALAIIDLPTPEYVDNFLNRPEWKSPSVVSNLEVFFWILGPGVGDHPRLREFVAAMSDCKHIVSSTDYCPNYLALQSVAGSAIRMSRLRPDNYPIPVHDNLRVPQTQSSTQDSTRNPPPFESAEPGLIVSTEPELNISTSGVVPRLDAASIMQRMPASAERRARIIKKRLRSPEQQERLQQYLKDLPGADVEIVTLGTGSSAPSKYRNVSSTLIYVPGTGYYLFDCGENTLGQLKRLYNPEQLRDVLRNLRLVWISHLHADHHLGTVSVLKAWYQENYPGGVPHSSEIETQMDKILEEKRLFLVSDSMMIEWLEEYASVEDFGFAKLTPLSANPFMQDGKLRTSFLYRHCRANGSYPGREITDSKPTQTELRFNRRSDLTTLLHKATGLSNILTTYVSHCRGSMAVALVFPNGFKVSFSGDCRPSPSFAAIGKHSTVLIHEATFNDDMVGSAIAKKHSTASEAIGIGRQMQARAIVLTHFSQRYQKIALIEQSEANQPTQAQDQAPQQARATLDIPFDNDTQEDLASDSPNASEPETSPPAVVPIVAAFDHMRVRVGDMLNLEAYAPATEKLFDIIERAAALDAKESRRQQDRESSKKDKKNKWKKGKEGAISPPRRSPSRSPRSPKRSLWDAPESESGWSSSESEKGASSR
ncbi:hypothetical protein BJX76DRAFT_344709 [Aspergillus varians]